MVHDYYTFYDYYGKKQIGYESDGSYDVWSFTADGGAVYLSVDTVSSSTAFDPFLIVTDGSTCEWSSGDDEFDCTYPPPSYSCPSAVLPSTVSGDTFNVIVDSQGSAVSGAGDYALYIDQGSEPSMSLVADDYTPLKLVTATDSTTTSATVTLK